MFIGVTFVISRSRLSRVMENVEQAENSAPRDRKTRVKGALVAPDITERGLLTL